MIRFGQLGLRKIMSEFDPKTTNSDWHKDNHQSDFGIKDSHCYHITQLVSLAQDTPLTFTQAMQVRGHLLVCKNCRHFAKNTQKLSQMMKTFKEQKR